MTEVSRSDSELALKSNRYREVMRNIDALLDGETDWVAAMATVVCELHNAFDYYHWTGFYRAKGDELIIGPYQGPHGCLRIRFGRGVCGTAAAEKKTQLVPDVQAYAGHIACSSSTRSEIVVPIVLEDGTVLAVLDVDSNHLNAFDQTDQSQLESLCSQLAERFGQVS